MKGRSPALDLEPVVNVAASIIAVNLSGFSRGRLMLFAAASGLRTREQRDCVTGG